MKICFLIIATNDYTVFLNPLVESIERFFLPNEKKKYFIFTDKDVILQNSEIIKIKSKPWPGDTLYRYHHFCSIEDKIREFDYVYYLDADMLVVDEVGEEVLTELLGVQHPGFIWNTAGTPEDKQTNSTAYLQRKDVKQYCCGGFNGGSTKEFLKLSKTIKKNIDKDDESGIIAVWHDESHLNKYFSINPPTKILDAGYCAPETAWEVPFRKKILALDVSADQYKKRK